MTNKTTRAIAQIKASQAATAAYFASVDQAPGPDVESSGYLKVCRTCGETKKVDAFPRKSRNADGISHYCRQCQSDERAHKAAALVNIAPDLTPAQATTCTATNKNGKPCKRVGYNWPQAGKVLCPQHAMDLAGKAVARRQARVAQTHPFTHTFVPGDPRTACSICGRNARTAIHGFKQTRKAAR